MTATKEDIITLPHPDLRSRSERVHVITDATKEVIQEMRDAMMDWENSRPHEIAVALAAVQIDRLERIVIVREDFDDKENRNYVVLINPEIIKTEGVPTVIQPEGCLSVKDLYGKVKRFPKVRVKAINEDGYEIRIKAEGFLSMLMQHEIDHTNGICFVDHIKDEPDAFSILTKDGDLEPIDYEKVLETGIFRD